MFLPEKLKLNHSQRRSFRENYVSMHYDIAADWESLHLDVNYDEKDDLKSMVADRKIDGITCTFDNVFKVWIVKRNCASIDAWSGMVDELNARSWIIGGWEYGRGSISGISKEWMTDLRYEGAIASLIDMCAEGMDSDFLPVLKKGERIRMWNLYPERFRPYIGEGEGIVADTHQALIVSGSFMKMVQDRQHMDNLTHFPYKLFHIHEDIAHKSDYGCETAFAIIPKAPARILWDCFIHGGFRKSNLTYLSAPFQVTENEADDARRHGQLERQKEVA